MNAVFAQSSASHNDFIAGFDTLFRTRPSVDFLWHHTETAHKNQRFRGEFASKIKGSIHGRNTTLVAALFDSLMDSRQNLRRIFQKGWSLRRVFCREKIFVTEAKDIGVSDGLGPQATAQDVAIDTQDSGQSSAKRIQSRGTVVSFNFDTNIDVVIPVHNSRIVFKNRDEVVAVFQLASGALNKSFIKTLHGLWRKGGCCFHLFLRITDLSRKNFVFAVLAPSLSQAL